AYMITKSKKTVGPHSSRKTNVRITVPQKSLYLSKLEV
ncbi:MAG: hypothetical protein ACI92E_003085, partial [Oceanicoccus sp.]